MSWVNDLASVLGIPAGAATLAVVMYGACVAAEKVARPEALKDVGRILKDPSWTRSVRPSAIIEMVFVWTFGERHLSWKCFGRSVLATICCAVITWLSLGLWSFTSLTPLSEWMARMGVAPVAIWSSAVIALLGSFIILGVLPDYAALAKTRSLVRLADRLGLPGVLLPLLDIGGSIGIAFLATLVYIELEAVGLALMSEYYALVGGQQAIVEEDGISFFAALAHSNEASLWQFYIYLGLLALFSPFSGQKVPFGTLLIPSTLFTSVWTILILLSTTVLKLLAPVHRFTAWFFDVEKHPLQAIGIVAGALVMIGSLFWMVVRAVI